MSNYCEPDWHDGQKVQATYMVRGMLRITDPVTLNPKFQVADWVTGEVSPMFAVCTQHLEAAVHGMSRWFEFFLVTVEQEA